MSNVFIGRVFAILLTLYFASIIVFKMYNINVTHFIDILLVSFFFLTLFNKKQIIIIYNPLLTIYLLFVLFTFSSSLWAVNFEQSSYKSYQLMVILLNLYVIYNIMKTYNLKNTFIYGILLASFMNYIILLGFIHVPFEVFTKLGGNRALGTVGNPNMLAIVMLISLLVSFLSLKKNTLNSKLLEYYHYINIILALYIIFLSMSKKGIIFGLSLLFIYLLLTLKNPIKILKILSLTALILYVAFNILGLEYFMNYFEHILGRFSAFSSTTATSNQFGSTGERIFLMKTGYELFSDRPLLGYGIANFVFLNNRHIYAHNNYIELLVGVGLIGTAIYYMGYAFILKMSLYLKDYFYKIIISFFIFILLMMDIALVSFGMKLIIYTLIFLTVYMEDLKRKEKFLDEKS